MRSVTVIEIFTSPRKNGFRLSRDNFMNCFLEIFFGTREDWGRVRLRIVSRVRGRRDRGREEGNIVFFRFKFQKITSQH